VLTAASRAWPSRWYISCCRAPKWTSCKQSYEDTIVLTAPSPSIHCDQTSKPTATRLIFRISTLEKYTQDQTKRSIMCNGTSTRTSQGGTIVVLQSKLPSLRPQLRRELSLKLSADTHNGQTIATFDGLDAHLGGSHFVIQSVEHYQLSSAIEIILN
jgi:hypothetical protein